MPAPLGLLTFTTDFGLQDAYVAQLHAAVLRTAPGVRIVDISHAVLPGDLEHTLFLTESAWPAFPDGCVHVVVVDPGVGTARPLVAIGTAAAFLVGPDTGVLSSGLPAAMRPKAGVARMPIPDGVEAVEITDTPVRAATVSATFQGRDILAPVAAALASGAPLTALGRPLPTLQAAAPLATPTPHGRGRGHVLHIDRFGNAITTFRGADLSSAFRVRVRGHTINGPVRTYGAAPDRALALTGSSGYVEIAWGGASAAERLGLHRGDAVDVEPR